jgi:hypothetical protein
MDIDERSFEKIIAHEYNRYQNELNQIPPNYKVSRIPNNVWEWTVAIPPKIEYHSVDIDWVNLDRTTPVETYTYKLNFRLYGVVLGELCDIRFSYSWRTNTLLYSVHTKEK